MNYFIIFEAYCFFTWKWISLHLWIILSKIPSFLNFFSRYNVSETGRLSLEELKAMMEKLGAPQTHLGLKSMIKVMDLNHSVKITKNYPLEIFLSKNSVKLTVFNVNNYLNWFHEIFQVRVNFFFFFTLCELN